MKKTDTKVMVVSAILIAAAIVLSRFLSINAWNLKIGFTFVPVFVAAFLYGPAAGALVGGIADFLGAILFPIGPYFPGFTLTCVLTGVLFGVLLHKKQNAGRILAATACNQLILGLLLNTFWISFLYGSSFEVLFLTRIIQCVVMMPVEFLMIGAICKVFSHQGKALVR